MTEPLAVLLHGLARTDGSMSGLGRALRAAGFEVRALDYPSRRSSIAALALDVADRLARDHGDRPLVAVTHSLGGIVFRHLHDPRLRWQRAVMLAPPNQGSQVAAMLADNPVFRWFYGPAGQELAGGPEGWPPPPAPTAIIAGARSLALANPTSWTRRFPPGVANDGTVAVDETRLDGAVHHTIEHATHTTIMDDPAVQALAIAFLREGVMP